MSSNNIKNLRPVFLLFYFGEHLRETFPTKFQSRSDFQGSRGSSEYPRQTVCGMIGYALFFSQGCGCGGLCAVFFFAL